MELNKSIFTDLFETYIKPSTSLKKWFILNSSEALNCTSFIKLNQVEPNSCSSHWHVEVLERLAQ